MVEPIALARNASTSSTSMASDFQRKEVTGPRKRAFDDDSATVTVPDQPISPKKGSDISKGKGKGKGKAIQIHHPVKHLKKPIVATRTEEDHDKKRFETLERVRNGDRDPYENPHPDLPYMSGYITSPKFTKTEPKKWEHIRPGRGHPPVVYRQLDGLANGPGGVWSCSEEGCSHQILDADEFAGMLDKEAHLRWHGEEYDNILKENGYEGSIGDGNKGEPIE